MCVSRTGPRADLQRGFRGGTSWRIFPGGGKTCVRAQLCCSRSVCAKLGNRRTSDIALSERIGAVFWKNGKLHARKINLRV